jgi:signal transduction histidine kinase
MKRSFIAAAAASLALFAAPGMASDKGSKAEAEKMVAAALAHIKAVGAEQAFKDFSTKGGKWHDRDLYVFCWDYTGTALCHGGNEKLVGKNFIDLKDPDGKPLIRGLIDAAKSAPGKGWVDYKWTNPVTKQVEAKTSWTVRIPGTDTLLGVGVYK